MPDVREATVHFHFGIEGLFVAADLLGTRFTVVREGRPILVTFPCSENDFGVNPASGIWVLGGGVMNPDGDWTKRSIRMVRATIDVDLPYLDGPLDEASFRPIHDRLRAAADIARSVLSDYVETVRTRYGQHWLGLGARAPRTAWITEVFDRHTGEDLHVGYQDPMSSVGLHIDGALTTGEHSAVIDAVRAEEASSLPNALLADAKYLAWLSDPPQRREALILSAMACEVKIKDVLRVVCPEPSKALLVYALDNPREVTQQAAGLFHSVAAAVTGHSLRDEDKALWKGLEALFADRNKVVHRGEDVDPEQLRNDLMSATGALRWAEGLRVEQGHDSPSV